MTDRPAGAIEIMLPKEFGGYAVRRRWLPVAQAVPGGIAARPGALLAKVERVIVGDTGYPWLKAADAAKDLGQAFGHFLVDDEDIIECVPALTSAVGRMEQACFIRARPGQGFDAQATAIAVNICFGGPKTAAAMLDRCVGLIAHLCKCFEISPERDVKRPSDLGEPEKARKDPDRALTTAGSDFEKLKIAVAGKLESKPPPEPAHA